MENLSFYEFIQILTRRKPLSIRTEETKLRRCLNTWDLIGLGIGATLGLGMYVVAGQVASQKAGPSVIISFLFAAIASVLAGLCYAEFGARVPKSGSAYVYSYVTVGEFIAFIIGWNLILEYVIGTASVARGYSDYLDSMFNSSVSRYFESIAPINVAHMSRYLDFLALIITLLLTVMLLIGVKESTRFNFVFTSINLSIVLFVIIFGSFKADPHNWALDPKSDNLPESAGNGGFFPFGFSGTMSGAATCFYSFIGFDVIATTGEEAKNPKKSIPISIATSLAIVFLAYFSVSTIQTLMWPYYKQKVAASLPYVFSMVGFEWARWVILIGALAGLSTSLLGAMFPMPRILLALADDGLIFRFLAKVHPKLKTPIIATLVSGIFSAVMAMLFSVSDLAEMMSIGTLLAYTLVAISVLILRFSFIETLNDSDFYQESISDNKIDSSERQPLNVPNENEFDHRDNDETDRMRSETSSDENIEESNEIFCLVILRYLFNTSRRQTPTKITSYLSCAIIFVIFSLCVSLDLLLVLGEDCLIKKNTAIIIILILNVIYLIISCFILSLQPRCTSFTSFRVPMIPYLPVLSIIINVYLMMKLSRLTWIRFSVWMTIGFVIYFGYGIRNSNEAKQVREIPMSSFK